MPVIRDPRVDPMRGDVLRKGKRLRAVIAVYAKGDAPLGRGPWVAFQSPTDKRDGTVQLLRPSLWDGWAKDAEVIHVAE